MKMKHQALILSAIVLAVGLYIILTLKYIDKQDAVRAKAQSFSEVCHYARSTLESDARILRSPNPSNNLLANDIILRVNGDRIGDGAQHLEWCGVKINPTEWAECRERSCYATILERTARSIK